MIKFSVQPQGCLTRLLAKIGLVLSVIYLANLKVGALDVINDKYPLVGNLDEVAAAFILFISLNALGIGPDRLFKRKEPFTPAQPQNQPPIQDAEIVEEDNQKT